MSLLAPQAETARPAQQKGSDVIQTSIKTTQDYMTKDIFPVLDSNYLHTHKMTLGSPPKIKRLHS